MRTWKLNNMPVKQPKEEQTKIKWSKKNTWRQVKIKAQQPKIFEMQKN